LISSPRAPSGRPALLPIRRQDEFEHQEEENEKKLSLQEYRKDTKLDVCKPKSMAKGKPVQAVKESQPILDLILLLGLFTVILTWSQWAYSALMYFA
jgi:hypothetical protein